jgi:hypothetical protein
MEKAQKSKENVRLQGKETTTILKQRLEEEERLEYGQAYTGG